MKTAKKVEWFRNETWNKKISEQFLKKLGSARSQRDRYLVIQALTLVPYEPKVTLEFVDLYFETCQSEFDHLRAYLARAEALAALKKYSEMVGAFHQVLDLEKQKPSQKSNVQFLFPYCVAAGKVHTEYAYALELLETADNRVFSPILVFKKAAAKAMILWEQGHGKEAKRFAEIAVRTGKIRRIGLKYRHDVDVIGLVEKAVLKRLMKIMNNRRFR